MKMAVSWVARRVSTRNGSRSAAEERLATVPGLTATHVESELRCVDRVASGVKTHADPLRSDVGF